ncbi:crt homolog 3-like [Ptychodera flava]|uniref:crt homolog 3-like n=1 Tax=Ptychodera flava TaxID=63121 RepID=UPI003969F982
MDSTEISKGPDSATWDYGNPSSPLISPAGDEIVDKPCQNDNGKEVAGAKRKVKISLPGNRHVEVSLRLLNIFLSTMTVISTVAMNVSLPIFSEVGNEFSDAYYVLFSCTIMFPPFFFLLLCISKLFDPKVGFMPKASMKFLVLAGLLNSMNGLFLVYASDPSRTPPALQAILSTSVIPFTVVSRYLILRKGVGLRRLVCTAIVMIGLFISMEPIIFNIDHADDAGSGKDKQTTLGRILWPCAFLLGFLPLAIMNVVLERIKDQETSSAVVNAWLNVYTLCSVVALFWTDFIPGFGMATSPAHFWKNLSTGFKCQYGGDPTCHDMVGRPWLFIVSYVMTYLFNFLLIRFADGAVYLVVVQALNTPLAALFWTLFTLKPYFHWNPVFDLATAFTLAGLAIMMPAVVMYRYFSDQEETASDAKQRNRGQSFDIQNA